MEETQDINRKKLLFSEKQIKKRVAELGKDITNDYGGKNLLLVGILRGAFLFIADLIRQIDLPVIVDFMAVSSYGSKTKSSGVVRILKDLDVNIKDYDVIIVEDIIDTGLTLQYLMNNLKSREPKSLEICTLLYKKVKHASLSAHQIKYIGFDIPDEFVIGYGLDVDEKYRNLKNIFLLGKC